MCDDLICRDKNGERLYSLQDANWNCVCATDSSGDVRERFCYDAFGNVNGLASDWNRTFTGQVFDSETGLMLYRNRFYSPTLGRFLQRDPIGYDAGDLNVYRYVGNSPTIFMDEMGLQQRGCRVWLYTGSYCVDDDVWNAALEAAGAVLQCWWDCEITTHTTTTTYIEGVIASTTSWSIFERLPFLRKPSDLLKKSPGNPRPDTSMLSRLATMLKGPKSNSKGIGQVLRNHMRYTKRAPIRAACRTGVIGLVVTETVISLTCTWNCR